MILIQTDRETLLKPLQAVTGIVERRHTLPILSNVLIERDDGALKFVATDLEIQVTTTTSGEGKDARPLAVTVAAKKLQDILRALPEQAGVSLESKDGRLQLKAGKSRFSLQTLPPEDFPRLAEAGSAQAAVTLPQGVLRSLLLQVQYAMAQQDIRYYLNGLLIVLEPGSLKLVATDGHRLAFVNHALQEVAGRQEVILPRKAVLELVKLLADSDEPVRLEVLANQVRFSFDTVVLVSKVIDGKFPDYARVVPASYGRHFLMDRITLQQALQRTSILSNEKFRGVRLVMTSGSLRVSCTNTDQEEAQEELEIDYSGEALDIGFNVTYLLDVLNNLSAEHVDCAFGDANSSALITVPGDADFRYVVMPMRI
ncbi:MAG TPA: DNA polymerase III subunit beta [Burkholderiales bacterium]|nr:DNA polymerase III subunit beta [Burkholderiales bacterium]